MTLKKALKKTTNQKTQPQTKQQIHMRRAQEKKHLLTKTD